MTDFRYTNALARSEPSKLRDILAPARG